MAVESSGGKISVATKNVPLTDDQKVEILAGEIARISNLALRREVIQDLDKFVAGRTGRTHMRFETKKALRHAELIGNGENAVFRPSRKAVQSLIRRRWNDIIPIVPTPKDRAIGTVFASGRGR